MTSSSPGITSNILGIPSGVTGLDLTDGFPRVPSPSDSTSNVYVVPFSNPVNIREVSLPEESWDFTRSLEASKAVTL